MCFPDFVSVVTGSTHGIGKAFAQELAGAGLNVVIVSIDEGDCKKVAQDIGTSPNRTLCCISILCFAR